MGVLVCALIIFSYLMEKEFGNNLFLAVVIGIDILISKQQT